MNKKELTEADIRTKFITPAIVGADGGNERGNEEDPGGAGRDQGAGRDRERLEKLADRVRDVVEQDGDGRRPLGRPGDVLLQYPGVR